MDRLEVGPPRVEARRVVTPYTVHARGATSTIDLVYRWEQDVFDPGDPASLNLAALVGAQVALNYGLFAGKIVFRGPLDANDRSFLEAAAENTAREIYVNKLLLPNPFIVGDAARLPAVKREAYLRARLLFPDEPPDADATGEAGAWSRDPSRHAVLSSGGKDSLLSFGLLREAGCDVHAVFLNESGRHWHTALNAYRFFKSEHAPLTARVWTNSDRVFAWMLRHLPFVRRDFADVRADIYPIRLWTVAVFLFGALPVLRARAIGRLVIGDEYDSTARARHEGIPHYAGLFDQSVFFDRMLTRYFARKGWGVRQFSILRPMSELLIQKILTERYPQLQRHQLSCHASHIDGERVRPCGRCEKCRRIVGMLVAIGADPRGCGYTGEQIDACLLALGEKGVSQGKPETEHLAYLLERSGVLSGEGKLGGARPRPRPEVVSLRFHPAQAPIDEIPANLREGLYGIMLEHADGAVERKGREWAPLDPIPARARSERKPAAGDGAEAAGGPVAAAEAAAAADESAAGKVAAGDAAAEPESTPLAREPFGSDRTRARPYVLGELSWPQARDRFEEVDVALLPVGAIEQHGPHLPLDIDAYDADLLARRVAAACSDPQPLVLPLIPYGVSYHHDDFSGTLSVNPETLARLVHEIGLDVASHGIKKLVIVNGHGGNVPALQLAAQMINRDAHIFTCVDSGETSDVDVEAIVDSPNDVHAGEIETSTALVTRPELVNMEAAPSTIPRLSSRYLDFSSKRSVAWYGRTIRFSPTGVMGDATRATAEKGEVIWELMTRRLVELIEEIKALSLEEIFQRRY